MSLLLDLQEIHEADLPRVGGKGFALAQLVQAGLRVPRALCVTTEAYESYLSATGLRDQILFELLRKPFEEMRWEEIWDTALRIRNLFLKTSLPVELRQALLPAIENYFGDTAVSVRSSAPGEDSAQRSFAGLHESFVNVRGPTAVLDHVRSVWASLWSDRAILYRTELGLDVQTSLMAVVIQEMVFGERSGVAFGRNPMDPMEAVVEAVHGLNQGLVDGTVEPDRWVIKRDTEEILSHTPALRDKVVSPGPGGAKVEPLLDDRKGRAPLKEREVLEVYGLTKKTESLFGTAQDVEWAYRQDTLNALQSRPITTLGTGDEDPRQWYLSLHRSFDNLKLLRQRIEQELIPAMEQEAAEMARKDLSPLSDEELALEIQDRTGILEKWKQAYERDCIPFAHGMRLFGQVYNDRMRPDNPYGFMDLLRGTGMVSIHRNNALNELAEWIRREPEIGVHLKQGRLEDCSEDFARAFRDLTERFGGLTWGGSQFGADQAQLTSLLLQMAEGTRGPAPSGTGEQGDLEHAFLSTFDSEEKAFAADLLDLARASYQLRDDDNTYLGKIEGQVLAAVKEGARRKGAPVHEATVEEGDRVVAALTEGVGLSSSGPERIVETKEEEDFRLRPRQLIGQPAGPGVASGRARVIQDPPDLFQFKSGEVLVCDAVDPNMTFVVPLAAAVVERRGGMLIHGAIIAREYGLPCVTGVADAAKLIRTGDPVTVDGFLGIVIVGDDAWRK
jgi:pyruvate,water dikinase